MDLGTITTKQKMVGVKFVARDANGNAVPSFNGLALTSDQPSAIQLSNQQTLPDLPAGSTYTVDIAGIAASTGPVTITATGQQGNFQPHFTSLVTITVTLDPSTPGVPTHFDITPGTVEPQ